MNPAFEDIFAIVHWVKTPVRICPLQHMCGPENYIAACFMAILRGNFDHNRFSYTASVVLIDCLPSPAHLAPRERDPMLFSYWSNSNLGHSGNRKENQQWLYVCLFVPQFRDGILGRIKHMANVEAATPRL